MYHAVHHLFLDPSGPFCLFLLSHSIQLPHIDDAEIRRGKQKFGSVMVWSCREDGVVGRMKGVDEYLNLV